MPTYDFAKFCEKLHEIEKILGRRGGTIDIIYQNNPLDELIPNLALVLSYNEAYARKQCLNT